MQPLLRGCTVSYINYFLTKPCHFSRGLFSVCNFLSPSAGFNLCSCFFRLTLVFRLHFRLSLGRPFHGLPPLPFRFLTPAVFAFSRPLPFGSDYSAFRAFLSFLPGLPCRRFLRCLSSSSVRPVSMPLFRFRYSAFCSSFLRPLPRLTVATSASQPSSFRLPASSLWLSL